MLPSARLALAASAAILLGCGSSPTEPMGQGQTTLRIVVTKCDLGGSVDVYVDNMRLGPLQTPGEATFMLDPGPHSLAFARGQDVFGGVIPDLNGISPGATMKITLTDPAGSCYSVAR